ncbi:MAG TPA: hypothetical protein VMM38_02255 [Aridibacter sp.]|nr:hypothetical protein [Aridibacter sp.]
MLPFVRGKAFFYQGGLVDKLIGGWQLTSIVNISSGPPISIKDINWTFNRTGRSNRQTANSPLTPSQIDDLIGIFHQTGVVYFIDPSLIGPDARPQTATSKGRPTRSSRVRSFSGLSRERRACFRGRSSTLPDTSTGTRDF